eukprot:Phypoly_transcript_15440.p1 GENE.Phypoly_transcript_15440~~Phypoly_transcript_15440.p1  ORF type:complete len:271 (+),score=33.26 Phypoly_transcript_15440:42-854(+)
MSRPGGWGAMGGAKPKFEYKKPADRAPAKIKEPERLLLQDGLVLLRGFLPLDQQKQIVTECMALGDKPTGGFYVPRPEKNAQAVLKLKIMCLGYHWNSEERGYQDTREDNDKTVPHPIPESFSKLCIAATEESKKVFAAMPSINPTVVICNLYKENGSLGWHKDDDEDQDTIADGLPIVSLSFGLDCVFAYKNFNNEKREVILHSGDALIFGGPSRLIGHNVASIVPNTSPLTNLRDARLNLTFREHTRRAKGEKSERIENRDNEGPKYA